jgi:cyanate permease
MRAIWSTIIATWALFAVLAVIAWTRTQPATTPQQIPQVAVVKGKNGSTRLVVVQSGSGTSGTAATTRTSPVAAG